MVTIRIKLTAFVLCTIVNTVNEYYVRLNVSLNISRTDITEMSKYVVQGQRTGGKDNVYARI